MWEIIAILSTHDLEGEMHKWIFRKLKIIFRALSSMFKCQGYLKSATQGTLILTQAVHIRNYPWCVNERLFT